MNKIAQAAITTSRKTMEGYWLSTLTQRLPGGAGSIVNGFTTAEALEKALFDAEWEEYSHPALIPGCKGFKTALSGTLGVVTLTTLPEDQEVTLDDRKNTGFVSCTVAGAKGETVGFVVLIVGEHEGKEVVFTFHPGEPVSPSRIKAEEGLHGKKITVKEAVALGLTTAKIV